jgi:hypothetical protein
MSSDFILLCQIWVPHRTTKPHLVRITERRMVMIKLAWRYARYALSALATIGFALTTN